MGVLAKGMTGLVAAALMTTAMAAPAEARRYGGGGWHHRDNHLSTGDVIGSLLVIGGIAAVASAVSKDKGSDNYGYGYGYSNGSGDQRDAVYSCVNEAERSSGYDNARVRDITGVDRRDGVYRVRGVVDIGRVDDDRGIRSFTCFTRNGEIYNFELNNYRF